MPASGRPARPALVPGLCFLGGVALAPRAIDPAAALAVGSCLLLAGMACIGRPRARRMLCCAALVALGAWRECTDRQGYAARREALFGGRVFVEREIEGRLTRSPQPRAAGEWSFALRGEDGHSVELVVRGTPPARLGVGDRVRLWCRLGHPREVSNPGSPPRGDPLRSRGIDAFGSVKSALLIERLAPARPGPLPWIDRAKRSARQRLDLAAGSRGDRRALLGAILLGERGLLSLPLRDRLQRSGLSHLVAISGFHVGIVALFSLALLRRGGLSAWGVLLVAVVALPAFGIAVGARPSVLRAVLGTVVLLWGRCLGREGDPLNTLALLAALLVGAEPSLLGDAGYRLSFLAAAGILVAAARGRHVVAKAVKVAGAAYLSTAPVVALTFGRLAPVAVISNLPAVPLCGWVLVTGYGAIALAGVPVLGALCARACELGADGLIAVIEIFASWSPGAFIVARPGPAQLILYYALLLAWITRAGTPRRLLAGAFAATAFTLHLGPLPRTAERTEATVLDVGQGQAVLLQGPRTGLALVDAAGSWSRTYDPGERIVLPAIASMGYRRVEVLALSHEHLDHAGGAGAIVRDVEVGELWLGPGWHRSPLLAAIAAEASGRGTAVVLAESGLRRVMGGLPLRLLAPTRDQAAAAANERSLVILAGEAPARLLLPGDVEGEGERRLVGSGADLRAEGLVLAHHGSRGANGQALLSRVRADHAVASCGANNRFGHPHAETLERLADFDVTLRRTDLHGAVRMRATASGWKVRGLSEAPETDRDQDEGECEDQDE